VFVYADLDTFFRFHFTPRSFEIGRWTSLAGIGIVLAVALAGARNHRRRPGPL
jgi:hypothetical protein